MQIDGKCVTPTFHLSLGVKSLDESIHFFTEVLTGKVLHRDPTGYVNIDLFGSQITLKENKGIDPRLPDFHFGFNLGLKEFNDLAQKILTQHKRYVTLEPKLVDPGTPLERKKMYLKCPTGYVVELKGRILG